ncbi:hypothetical protein ACMD2_15156 [Ananas comosus]|uniref:Uncharacterized protein n=1 Tax=Ananas comosus TaxID=4615 RepID=A0A199VSS8_ANACO|nr:hypothetical protein ACMD2_15156 [Ananas comosus]
MRGLGRLAATPSAAGKQTLISSSALSYSTFSPLGGGGGGGGGGGAGGRGRGRGALPPPPSSATGARVPGKPDPDAEDGDPFAPPPGLGHGRGHPVLPSSPVLPSFSSWMSSLNPSASSASAGRGRGAAAPPSPPSDPEPKRPIFFKRDADPEEESSSSSTAKPLPASISPLLPGAGRGKPTRPAEPAPRAAEENRHLRRRSVEPSASPSPPKMGREEAVRKAVEVLSRGGGGGGGGPGRGGRGRGRAMTRGRGARGRGRFGGRGERGDSVDSALYLGDGADGERLQKRLGEEKMKILNEAFEEVSWRALPSPMEDAYLDALHTNNMIEYEPEYLVEFENPDIDEKPPMSLRDALEKAKPFLMAYEGIQSQEEWEEAVKETMEKVPHMKELMDMYCGPDRVTAKQQQEELRRVANTLPENIPSSVKRFTDRALLSLQSNPGWGWDKKCQFMDKLVWEVSQHYK